MGPLHGWRAPRAHRPPRPVPHRVRRGHPGSERLIHWPEPTPPRRLDTFTSLGTSETVAGVSGTAGLVRLLDPAGGALAVRDTGSGAVNWVLPDLHGNIAGGLAGSTVTSALRYDGYGVVLATGSAGGTPVAPERWRTQGRMDLAPAGSATPRYDAGARDYSPGLGTFTSLDPVRGSALDPASLNRYLYAHANPATLIDPDGHAACNTKYDNCSMAAYRPQKHGPRYTVPGSTLTSRERARITLQIRTHITNRTRDRRGYDGDAILGYRAGPIRSLLAEAYVALGSFEARYDRDLQQSILPDVVGGVDPGDVARLRAINAALGSLRLAGDHAGADTLFRAQQRLVPMGYGMASATDWTEVLLAGALVVGLGSDGPSSNRRQAFPACRAVAASRWPPLTGATVHCPMPDVLEWGLQRPTSQGDAGVVAMREHFRTGALGWASCSEPRSPVNERLPELMRSINGIYDACRVQAGERVVVYTDSQRRRELADLFVGVAAARGCEAIELWGEARPHLVEPSRAAVEAMKTADIVFDFATPWLYTRARNEIMDGGKVRILQLLPPESMLIERPPDPVVMARARKVGPLFDLSPTQEVRITSDLGTDLTASFKGRAVSPEDGVVEYGGEWDSQGMGFVNCFPIEDSAEGTIVLNGPFHFSAGAHDFIPTTPVTVTIRGGGVVKVEGGPEARQFETWLDSWGTPNARKIAHLGIGYDPRNGPIPKPIEAGDFGSWESFDGGVIVAFGANLGRSGGQNVAPNHCDLVVLGATYTLDGRDLVRSGECLLDSF